MRTRARFSVHQALGGGTLNVMFINNIPSRLEGLFGGVDLRTDWERERDIRLSRQEIVLRAAYCFFKGTTV